MLRMFKKWKAAPDESAALKRYFRDEHLAEDLEMQLTRERESASNLERSIYAARSYFAA